MNPLPVLCLSLLAALPAFAAEPVASKFPAPAKVMTPTREADLASLTLTVEAERRLGIATAAVERKPVRRTRLFGGDAVLAARTGAGGTGTNSGQSVFAILPALTPADLVRLAQSQVEADGLVAQARVTLELAKVALVRAEQLLRDQAGSARSVDEARAQFGNAEANLTTARERRELLGPRVLDGTNPPVLWLRVPIYVGDLAKLDAAAQAEAGNLNDPAGAPTRHALPVSAPPSANAGAATVDLFYEVANPDGALRPGQRVGVTIPFRTDEESLVVPWSAVLHDIQGGTWVYERTAPQAYTRRRVQVVRVTGNDAVLASGVRPGAQIVTAGAAELFGTEFGIGK